jgi:DNA-binding response OmpR family regulator
MQQRRVLIVDDDEVTSSAIARVLQAAGYDVEVHGSGFGLAGAVRAFSPDVVLVDLQMPGLGGTAAVRIVKEVFDRFAIAPPPVMIFSGASPNALAEAAAEMGAAAYLPKSATYAELLERVADLVGVKDEAHRRAHQ